MAATRCPKCQFDNQAGAVFCAKCATKLGTGAPLSFTKTLETTPEGLGKGKLFAGRFELIEELGSGGMGIVCRAFDKEVGEEIALKILHPEIALDERTVDRFRNEIKLARRITHKNVCRMHELHQDGKQLFITMEYVPGQDLKGLIKETGALATGKAISIAKQVAEGLAEAHDLGVIHRDLKPQNIMVDKEGNAKIMDFGIARSLRTAGVTAEGMIIGTPEYMAPEQVEGQETDQRTDIWSLGVLLYESLSGQMPFPGEYDHVVLYSILHHEPKPLRKLRVDIPVALERIVNRALKKNPDERYQNAEEMLTDLIIVKKDLETGLLKEALPWPRNLLIRRVPQISGLYLLASLGIFQLVTWLVDHFPISPNLPLFFLAAFISLLPTVLLLAYFHGRRGPHRYRRAEKISILTNMMLSAGLLFLLFQGKNLGATTKSVAIVNENRQIVNRVIPKNAFRRKLGIFFFNNEKLDSTLNWLQYAIPYLLAYDLYQDYFIDIYVEFGPQLRKAGYPEGINVPLTLKKKLADDWHLNFFVAGSFVKQNDVVTLKANLYETKNAKLIAESVFSGTDFFPLIDSLSVQLKHNMKIPKYHIEETMDLPLSERFSNSKSAAKKYFLADYEIWHNNDVKAAATFLEEAIAEDSTFAAANFFLHEVYRAQSAFNLEKSKNALRAAMKYKDKLPEMLQFRLKSYYFALTMEVQKVFDNAKNWIHIFPDSTEGHQILANIYKTRNLLDEAISEYKSILRIDPEQYYCFHSVGSLYAQKGEFDKALKYCRRYADLFPNDAASYTALGELYRIMGDFIQAKTYYTKALLLEPGKVPIMLALANLEFVFGNFEKAMKQHSDALKLAETPDDKCAVYMWQSNYYRSRGQIRKADEFFRLALGEMQKFFSPARLAAAQANPWRIYGSVESQNLKDFIDLQLGFPYYKVVSYGYFLVYRVLWDEDPDKADRAQKSLDALKSFRKINQMETDRYLLWMSQGQIYQLKNDFIKALESFQTAWKLSPHEYKLVINIALGENNRKLGKIEKAEESLQKTIKVFPFEPLARYEMALVYWEMGKKEEAMEHLKKALDVWRDADSEFNPAKKAREKLAEWQVP